MAEKTPVHMHSHPVYAWVALVFSLSVILGVAGWYYLIYSQGLNDDLVQSVQNLATTKHEAIVSSSTTQTEVSTDIDEIEQDINSVPDSDLSDVQLDNTILGIQ